MDDTGKWEIISGEIVWKSENQERATRFAQKYQGQRAVLKTKKWRKQKSTEQRGYYWAVLIPIMHVSSGYSPEECHELLKGQFLGYDKIDSKGIMRRFTGSTEDLDTLQAEVYYSSCREFISMEYGAYVPLPNERIPDMIENFITGKTEQSGII